MWYNLLNIKGIKINDGFFAIGGNSVLSVILAQKISKNFNIKFHTSDLLNIQQ
ncbi:acyl carrier protein [Candidatus Profftella armatura]